MAIPSEWAGPPFSPTLPYCNVSKVCLMQPGLPRDFFAKTPVKDELFDVDNYIEKYCQCKQ